jgi:hypothetical protein
MASIPCSACPRSGIVGFAKSIGGVPDDRADSIPEQIEELRLGIKITTSTGSTTRACGQKWSA